MGVVENISLNRFPAQGSWLGRKVTVCFHYQPADSIEGVVVRDDAEEPGEMIIRLVDGRHVLSTECMYSAARATTEAPSDE